MSKKKKPKVNAVPLPDYSHLRSMGSGTFLRAEVFDSVSIGNAITNLATRARRAVSRGSGQVYTPMVDVSHWQGEIDWAAAYLGGVRGVYMKATQSTGYVDPKFHDNWQGAHDVGMVIGVYHFMNTALGGLAQATHLMNTIQDLLAETNGQILPICADIESVDGVSNSVRINNSFDFLAGVQDGTGKIPLMYTSPYFANTYLSPTPAWINQFWSWIAHWTAASEPIMPNGWNRDSLRLWQYGIYPTHSWAEAVSGFQGAVDVDRYLGDEQSLRDWAGLLPPQVPAYPIGSLRIVTYDDPAGRGVDLRSQPTRNVPVVEFTSLGAVYGVHATAFDDQNNRPWFQCSVAPELWCPGWFTQEIK